MRSLLRALIAISVLALLGVASAASAQEAESSAAPAESSAAPAAPVVVSGTLECLGEAPADASPAVGASAAPAEAQVTLHEWVASDARLSGEVSYRGTWHIYGEPSEDRGTDAARDQAVYAIVNEGGAWMCEASRIPDPRVPSEQHTLVFDGQGEYEGMTAYLHIDWTQAPYAFTGLILPGDEPPYAEPQG
jgi:hypothetical protein